jgi:[glutamine synthetase] adenylyltransferase / [glutamine synthetase]-adenylyl-L-tyrosine phosphorylase
MTAASDLDLIVIYDVSGATPESNGRRPLSPGLYWARLTQRLISALIVPTKAGKLYEVDLRLRPSGRKGPLATQFSAFQLYQRDEAETWEHMALTRARVVAGDASLAREIGAATRAILSLGRDPAKLKRDAREMRALIAKEKPGDDPWDLKLASGGLLDIEFIAQYLMLSHARARPQILDVSTRAALARAGEFGLVSPDDAATLVDAHRLFTDVTQMLRLTVPGAFDPATAASGVKRRIATATHLPDFEALAAALEESRAKVREVFRRVLG